MRRWMIALVGSLATAGCEVPESVDVQQSPSIVAEDEAAEHELTPEGEASFSGVGQEPGWALRIYDNAIVYDTDYGQRQIVVPTPDPEEIANGRSYVTAGLTIRIVDTPCEDTMSGAPYPATVTIIEDERSLQGCGGNEG